MKSCLFGWNTRMEEVQSLSWLISLINSKWSYKRVIPFFIVIFLLKKSEDYVAIRSRSYCIVFHSFWYLLLFTSHYFIFLQTNMKNRNQNVWTVFSQVQLTVLLIQRWVRERERESEWEREWEGGRERERREREREREGQRERERGRKVNKTEKIAWQREREEWVRDNQRGKNDGSW